MGSASFLPHIRFFSTSQPGTHLIGLCFNHVTCYGRVFGRSGSHLIGQVSFSITWPHLAGCSIGHWAIWLVYSIFYSCDLIWLVVRSARESSDWSMFHFQSHDLIKLGVRSAKEPSHWSTVYFNHVTSFGWFSVGPGTIWLVFVSITWPRPDLINIWATNGFYLSFPNWNFKTLPVKPCH